MARKKKLAVFMRTAQAGELVLLGAAFTGPSPTETLFNRGTVHKKGPESRKGEKAKKKQGPGPEGAGREVSLP